MRAFFVSNRTFTYRWGELVSFAIRAQVLECLPPESSIVCYANNELNPRIYKGLVSDLHPTMMLKCEYFTVSSDEAAATFIENWEHYEFLQDLARGK